MCQVLKEKTHTSRKSFALFFRQDKKFLTNWLFESIWVFLPPLNPPLSTPLFMNPCLMIIDQLIQLQSKYIQSSKLLVTFMSNIIHTFLACRKETRTNVRVKVLDMLSAILSSFRFWYEVRTTFMSIEQIGI